MKLIKHPWIFLLIACVITLIIKIPHLGLPYFFDETYSYFPAIQEMAKTGPTLIPGSLPILMSKGHPLFFYFLASLWMKYIAGHSIIMMHVFPLLISLLALFALHRFAKRHTNIELANTAVVLMSVQALFLAQASLVLPEVLLFALFMFSFDAYLSRNYGLFAIFGSLMILTKETAAVFLMVFGLAYVVENVKTWKTPIFWKNLILTGTPVLVYFMFLLLHYRNYGSFFFDEHLGYITIDRLKVLYKFNSSFWMIFLAQGRNLLFFAAMIALITLLFRKTKIEYARFLILCIPFVLIFIVFTVLNFYVYRYVLPILGIVMLALLSLLSQIRMKYLFVNMAFIAAMFFLSLSYTASKSGQSDSDLGYVDYLVVHQEMVKYCESQNWYNHEIGGGYNMVMSLRDHYAGYLSTDKNFKTHHLPGITNRDIIIYDSTCWPNEMPENEKSKLTLVKRFEHNKHWGEIYRTNTFTQQ